MAEHAILLLIALALDWFAGDPKWLWARVPHPVVIFGKAIATLDNKLNDARDNAAISVRKGAIAVSLLILGMLGVAMFLDWVFSLHQMFGRLAEIAIIWIILAQKSLVDHVNEVATSLANEGLAAGRTAVGMIVGRDPEMLDESAVARAAIESLAENFCDGVVAPAFWYLIFGLPGLLIYKMINTADSMIAYRNEKYLHFGRLTAQIDDLANWLPARISAVLIAMGAAVIFGFSRGANALNVTLRDAGLHRSPNAGWPEAAMAGGCDIALGGPRIYSGETVSQAYINGTGKLELGAKDITSAIKVFAVTCFFLWSSVVIWWILI